MMRFCGLISGSGSSKGEVEKRFVGMLNLMNDCGTIAALRGSGWAFFCFSCLKSKA